jgi:hypothetical protein
MRILLLLVLLCLLPATAAAEALGAIRLPDTVPDIPPDARPSILDPAPLSDAWARPDNRPLGVTLSNYALTQQQIDAARQTGCGMVRLYIPMEHFIDGADADWSTLDQVISRLNRAGLEVLAVLDADGKPTREFFRDFCRNVASRYCESLNYYQILDNINYKIGLTTRDYADLLAICRPTIRMGDKDAVIVSGGIRGCDVTFLDMLENQRATRHLDVLAFNLYPPSDGIEQPSTLLRNEHSLPHVEHAVRWARARGKQVWVTSLGASTDTSWVGMDEVTQASVYARGSLVLGWLGVERVIFAAIQDADPSYQVPALCCGLLNVAGEPKASYRVLRSLNEAIQGAYHTSTPFTYTGEVYRAPKADDILNRHEDNVATARQAFQGVKTGGDDAYMVNDPLSPFKIGGVQVYSYWFYAPATREYRLIYWLGSVQPFDTLITVSCTNPRLTPFAEHFKPETSYQMLDYQAQQPQFIAAQNMVMVMHQRLDTVPCVISFQVAQAAP